MLNRRAYWHYCNGLDISQKIYYTPELIFFIRLSKSFSRLGIDDKIGFQLIWNFYFDKWQELITQPSLLKYYSLIRSVCQKLRVGERDKLSLLNFNKTQTIGNHILFYMNPLTMSGKPFCNPILSSYYLNCFFDMHFIRVTRRYNKRYLSRARVISRPSFWLGNSISCLLVSMFWGASMHWVDWVLVQPVIIDVNLILFFLYILIFYKFIIVSLAKRIRLGRLYSQKPNHQVVSFIQYYFNKIKWLK